MQCNIAAFLAVVRWVLCPYKAQDPLLVPPLPYLLPFPDNLINGVAGVITNPNGRHISTDVRDCVCEIYHRGPRPAWVHRHPDLYEMAAYEECRDALKWPMPLDVLLVAAALDPFDPGL